MNIETRWFLVIVASTVAAIIATMAATGNAWSMVPLLWFLAVCPGMPFVRMLRPADPVQRWIAAIGLSMAIDAIVAEVLLYTRTYTVVRAVVILGAIACLGAGGSLRRLRTRGDPEPAEAEPTALPV
jgi:hypothetical protein